MPEAMYPNPSKQIGEESILIRDAKTLLQSHRLLLSRKVVVRAEIDSVAVRESRKLDGKIEEMALGGRQLTGLPRSGRHGSATEHIALQYRDKFEQDVRDEIAALAVELQSIELNLTIYDAMLLSLTKAEALFVRLHYDEGVSYTKLIQGVGNQEALKIYSVSTLKRMNQMILSKIDQALGSVSMKSAN